MIISVHGGFAFVFMGIVREPGYSAYWPIVETCINTYKLPPFEMAEYYNNTHGYSILYPVDWALDEPDERIVHFRAPLEIGGVLIDVMQLDSEITLDEYHESVISQAKNKFPDFVEISNTKIRENEAVPAYLLKYSTIVTIKGKSIETLNMALTMISDSSVFMIDAGAPKEYYEQYEPIFSAMMNSFTLLIKQ